ncbi:MAG: phage portal protein [Oscillospiraceae bacterium]
MGLFDRILGKEIRSELKLSQHFSDIERWNDIYSGGGDWRYTRKGGLNGGSRRLASLGAAKAVCAELSRLCFTEGSEICAKDSDSEEFIRRVLSENRFAQRFPVFLEKVFALGGGAIKVYFDGGIKLDMITADRFIPTKWGSGAISGAAFASDLTDSSKSYTLAQTQAMDGDDLVIENRLFNENGGAEKLARLMPSLKEKSTIKGIKRPLFVYLGTGAPKDGVCSMLGSSVFAPAIDTLKGIDIVFDSLTREFILGKKRIIVPYYAVRGEYDENGDIRRYFDVNDEVFQAMSVSDSEDLKITDNTAQLRVAEHTEALNALLDLLCMQVGLSEGALSYKDGTIRTAAEVVSRNSRTYRTQAFYRGIIADALSQMTELICILGKMTGTLPDSAAEGGTIVFADGAAEDDATRIKRSVELYSAGIISKTRAISQIYGISLDEAKEMERTDFDGREQN